MRDEEGVWVQDEEMGNSVISEGGIGRVEGLVTSPK